MARSESKASAMKRYRSRLDHCRRYRQHQGYDDTWRRMVDLYRGRHFPGGMTDEDRIAINLSFSTINVIFPSITVNNPKIDVTARKPEDEDRALITEVVVNYWWQHFGFRDPFRAAIKDFLMAGHGWVKVGWRHVEEVQALAPEELDAELEELISQADAFAAQSPELAADLPTDEEIAAQVPATKTVVLEDRPFMERVSPHDMFVDPEATCMEDAGWLAQRIVRHVEEVRKDERYRQSVRSKVKPDAQIKADEHWDEQRRRRQDGDVDRVTVWEFYDLRRNTVCAFAEESDDFLIEPTPIPYASGHPFVFIPNYEVPDEFYPLGDLEQLECLQQELNKTRTQMMTHRKRYSHKVLYKESAFGREGREALQSADESVAVPVQGETPLTEVIVPMPIQALDASLYNYSEIIEQDLDKVSGVNEFARGGSSDIRRTATEVATLNDAANARSADKLMVIEASIGKIARKMIAMAQQFLTGEQVARVAGAEGQSFWVPFDWDDVHGEFDFIVEGGSTQPQNENFKRQQALAMVQSLGPFVGTVVDPYELARYVLQYGFGIKNPGKFLMDPMQAQLPGGLVGPGVDAPGPEGADAPQLDPRELLELQQNPADPAVLAQLEGQVGLNL